jgi:hypothetical protein
MASENETAAAAVKMGQDMAAQLANAANAYGGAFGSSFKAVQDYQAKLMQVFQANAEANMQLAQKMMQIRSPSEFVETMSTHLRERAVAIGEQTKELAALGQEASRNAVENLGQTKV